MGQSQHAQSQLAGFPFTEFLCCLSGFDKGSCDFCGIKFNQSSITLFDLIKHLFLLAGSEELEMIFATKTLIVTEGPMPGFFINGV
jgi:hypothetical protein